MPAQAGIHANMRFLSCMDPRMRGDDVTPPP
jgi:hypothetical protein